MTNPPPSEDLPRPRRLALIPALVALVVVVGYALSLSLLLGYDDRDGYHDDRERHDDRESGYAGR